MAAALFCRGRAVRRAGRGQRVSGPRPAGGPGRGAAVEGLAGDALRLPAGGAGGGRRVFGTNWFAHGSLKPAYLHDSGKDNWYDFTYQRNGREVESYWKHPAGIDRGEPSPKVYALNVLVGHHGIFSLTPVWLLSLAGMFLWMWPRRATRGSAAWPRRSS